MNLSKLASATVLLVVSVACTTPTTTEPALTEPEDPSPTEVTDPDEDAAPLEDGGAQDARTDAAKERRTVDGPVDNPKSCDDVCESMAMTCVGSVDAAYERPSTGGIRHRTFDCATAPPATINLPNIAEDGILVYYTCSCEGP
jgi:hypothetical protein